MRVGGGAGTIRPMSGRAVARGSREGKGGRDLLQIDDIHMKSLDFHQRGRPGYMNRHPTGAPTLAQGKGARPYGGRVQMDVRPQLLRMQPCHSNMTFQNVYLI